MTTLSSIQTRFRSLTETTVEVHRIMRSSPYPSNHPEAKLLLELAATYLQGAVLAFAGKSTDYSDYERTEALQELCDDCLKRAQAAAIKATGEQKAIVEKSKSKPSDQPIDSL